MDIPEPLRFLITAGPTREPIDPVRFISNRSSGKMGYALASAAAAAGHSVVLVSGPVAIPVPVDPNIRLVGVETTREMYAAVEARLGEVDVAIMAAAVADWRPVSVRPHKVKKSQQGDWVLHLRKTEDILGSAREPMGFHGLLVGFAAETENLEAYARDKMQRKRCDLMVANDVSQPGIGFDADENEVMVLQADGGIERLPRAAKTVVARELVRIIEGLSRQRRRTQAS